eukprot:g14365.t1
MPCTLLLASDPLPSGGVKAIFHPLEIGDKDSPIPADSAANTGGSGVGGGPASRAVPASVAGVGAAAAAAAAAGEGGEDVGPLVGVSVVMDCRVACTVELLWDVDLALLGKEMGLHPKLHLLPASTGGDGSSRSNAINAIGSGNASTAAAAAASTADHSNSSGGRSGVATLSSFAGGLWNSAVSASGRLGRTINGGSGSGRWGRRVAAGVGAHRDSSAPSGRVQQGSDGWGSGANGGGGYPDTAVGDDDEEMGRRRTNPGASPAASGGAAGGGGVDIGDVGGTAAGAAGARRAGGGGGSEPVGSRSWAASLGLRKSSVLNGGGADEAGGTVGQILGINGGNGRGGRGGAVAGVPGARMGLCGKRTVPRALSAGGNRVFETLPGESYFRGRPQSGVWAEGAAGAGSAASYPSGLGSGASSSTAAALGVGGSVGGGGGAGVGGGGGRRRWPRVEDSVRAGRCSLAIVIRPAAGAESGDWSGWRHRPTHRVTRQVLLVQLTERSTAAGSGGVPQQAPSARCLRHLVAISKGGAGDAEAIYSFSEVFGASDEAGGAGRQAGPGSASIVGSVQATAGGGSSSSTVDTGSNLNTNGSSIVSGDGGGSSQQQVPAGGVGGGGGGGGAGGAGEDLPEECVICLTEPKDTLLLPCRHLCVCTECFRHVDKCPVCRSAFDNYIVLSGPPEPPPPSQRQQQQASSSQQAGAARNTTALAPGGGGEHAVSGGAGGDSASHQQQRLRTAGSYSSSLATAAASMLPTVSLPGMGGRSRNRGGGAAGGDDRGAGAASSPSGEAVLEYQAAYDALHYELDKEGGLECVRNITLVRSEDDLVQPKAMGLQHCGEDDRLENELEFFLADANLAKPYLDKLVEEVTQDLEQCEVQCVDVKSLESTRRKAKRFCGGDVRKVAYMARVTVICGTTAALEQVYRKIMGLFQPQDVLRILTASTTTGCFAGIAT